MACFQINRNKIGITEHVSYKNTLAETRFIEKKEMRQKRVQCSLVLESVGGVNKNCHRTSISICDRHAGQIYFQISLNRSQQDVQNRLTNPCQRHMTLLSMSWWGLMDSIKSRRFSFLRAEFWELPGRVGEDGANKWSCSAPWCYMKGRRFSFPCISLT